MVKVQKAGSIIDYYAQLCKAVGLRKNDLIYPVFVSELNSSPLSARNNMFGMVKIALKDVVQHIQKIIDEGISSVIIFGSPDMRDVGASSSFNKDGIVQKCTRKIKKEFGGLVTIITDVCICQYNLTGHCGLQIRNHNGARGNY